LLRYEFPGRAFLVPVHRAHDHAAAGRGHGFVFILGRAGTVNVILMDYLGFTKPINFMYGVQGVLLVETLHLFPLMTLSIVDAMGKISPSLDEAAESVGSRGLRKFWDITFRSPLRATCPARCWSSFGLRDFATPLGGGRRRSARLQAYLNIVQFVDRRLFKMGIVISAIMVILAILFLIVAKKYVAIKDYSSLSYSVIERKQTAPGRQSGGSAVPGCDHPFGLHPYSGSLWTPSAKAGR